MICKPAYLRLYITILMCYCVYTLGSGQPYSEVWTVEDWCLNLEAVVRDSGVDHPKKHPGNPKHHPRNDGRLLQVVAIDGTRTIGSALSIKVELPGPVDDVMMQARTVTAGVLGLPTGTWDSPDDVSCSGHPHDSALMTRVTHVTLEWTPDVKNDHIQFIALARTNEVTSLLWSEIVTLDLPAPDLHAAGLTRIKRDASLENDTSELLDVSDVTSSMSDVTTMENVMTTEGSQSVDLMSYFNLLTIVGSYILMYTIFSFLII